MNYSYRPSAIEKQKTIALAEDEIKIEQEGKQPVHIRYSDIISINPKFVGSKQMPNLFQTVIKQTNGKDLVIRNYDYKGLLNMEEISDRYTPFILELHVKAAAVNSNILFKQGYSKIAYILMMGILVVAFLVLAIVTLLLLIAASWWTAALAAFGTLMIFLQSRKFGKRNKPRIYTVDQVPPDLLPGI